MFCIKCGTELEVDARYCFKCGFPVPDSLIPSDEDLEIVQEDNQERIDLPHAVEPFNTGMIQELAESNERQKMRAFIGSNADYYIKKWKASSSPEKSASWNWPAFWIPLYWLAYRKMYVFMTIVLVIDIIIGVFVGIFGQNQFLYLLYIIPLGIRISLGIYANALYYRHMQKKRDQWENDPSLNTRKSLAQIGGTSWIGIIVILSSYVLILLVTYFIAIMIVILQARANTQSTSHLDQHADTHSEVPSITENKSWSVRFGTGATKYGVTGVSFDFSGNSPIYIEALFEKPIEIDKVKVDIFKLDSPKRNLVKSNFVTVDPSQDSIFFKLYDPKTDKHLNYGFYQVIVTDHNGERLIESSFNVTSN